MEEERSLGGAANMQAAAVRCGIQCQAYIRALQRGIQVHARLKNAFGETLGAISSRGFDIEECTALR